MTDDEDAFRAGFYKEPFARFEAWGETSVAAMLSSGQLDSKDREPALVWQGEGARRAISAQARALAASETAASAAVLQAAAAVRQAEIAARLEDSARNANRLATIANRLAIIAIVISVISVIIAIHFALSR